MKSTIKVSDVATLADLCLELSTRGIIFEVIKWDGLFIITITGF
jgi:hypothetical protein